MPETTQPDSGSTTPTSDGGSGTPSNDAPNPDAGATDSTPNDGGAPVGGAPSDASTLSDAGAPAGGTPGDAGTSGDAGAPADGTGAPSDAGAPSAAGTSAPAAPVDHKQMVAIPSGINNGLTAVGNAAMIAAFGEPGAKTTDCSAITNKALADLTVTASVGPFRVTGLRPAVDAIARVFSAVQAANPTLYALLGTEGMSCVRLVRGSTTHFSNHSWGTAIDIKIGGVLTPRGSTTVSRGLLELCPFFHAEQFFWGAGFSTPDGMHFEVSDELLHQWQSDGTLP